MGFPGPLKTFAGVRNFPPGALLSPTEAASIFLWPLQASEWMLEAKAAGRHTQPLRGSEDSLEIPDWLVPPAQNLQVFKPVDMPNPRITVGINICMH